MTFGRDLRTYFGLLFSQDEAEPSEEEVERVGLLLSLVGSEMHRQRNFEFINAVLRVVLDVHTPLIQSSDPLR